MFIMRGKVEGNCLSLFFI